MRTCTSAAPASRSIRTRARWVLPRTIESSTTTRRLPRMTSRSGLSLSRMPSWRMRLRRRDEGAPDVGVLDQALAVRDAGLLGVADRGGRAGLGRRDDQVGLDRVLAGERAAHLDPGRVHDRGRRWWCRGGRGRRTRRRSPCGSASANRCVRRPSSSMAMSSPGSISRTNEAPTMSSAAVSQATTQPRSRRPRTRGRMPCGSRAAYRVCSSMKTKQKAPRSRGSTSSAVASSERSGSSASSAVTSAVSVVLPRASSPPLGAEALLALGLDEVAQLGGVGEVAVVGQGDRAGCRGRRASAGRSPRWSRRWSSSGSGRWRGGPCSERRASARRRPGRPGPCPCRRGCCGRWRWRCPPTPARGAAARRGRSRSAWRLPRREPRRRRRRRRPAGPSRRGGGRG